MYTDNTGNWENGVCTNVSYFTFQKYVSVLSFSNLKRSSFIFNECNSLYCILTWKEHLHGSHLVNRPRTPGWWRDHLLKAGRWGEGWAGQGRLPEHTESSSRTGHPIDLLSHFPAQSDSSHWTASVSIARVRRVHYHQTKHDWKW